MCGNLTMLRVSVFNLHFFYQLVISRGRSPEGVKQFSGPAQKWVTEL